MHLRAANLRADWIAQSRKAAPRDGLSIVKPQSALDHNTTHYRAEIALEAKILATTTENRDLEQLDTGSPPFCC